MELTARHRITSVQWDEREHAVVMVVEITDPQTARPVDVRIDVIDGDAPRTDARVRAIGRIVRGGKEFEVVGTYLGVVADEN
jgi:stalled ribosome rescue protein Dom34